MGKVKKTEKRSKRRRKQVEGPSIDKTDNKRRGRPSNIKLPLSEQHKADANSLCDLFFKIVLLHENYFRYISNKRKAGVPTKQLGLGILVGAFNDDKSDYEADYESARLAHEAETKEAETELERFESRLLEECSGFRERLTGLLSEFGLDSDGWDLPETSSLHLHKHNPTASKANLAFAADKLAKYLNDKSAWNALWADLAIHGFGNSTRPTLHHLCTHRDVLAALSGKDDSGKSGEVHAADVAISVVSGRKWGVVEKARKKSGSKYHPGRKSRNVVKTKT